MLSSTIALNRFGLGARPGDIVPGDGRTWLLAQFERFNPRPQALASVPGRPEVVGAIRDYMAEARMDRAAKRNMPMQAAAMPSTQASPDAGAALPDPERRFLRRNVRDFYVAMAGARMDSALNAQAPLVERLVHFWANHFSVSADKLPVVGLAGLLEFEAIRPNVLGKFSDLLLAVERHPAMLIYLDQAQSIGPNSEAGQLIAERGGKQRGLNENLAREILELHTLGVRTGYTQGDVTEFARALTGWTVAGLGRGPGARLLGGGTIGEFHFADRLHEPGERQIMGRRYPQNGENQARAVLLDVAASPATARHLATKLARHFAGDEPPAAMVDRLSAAYLKSGGDLPAVYRAIIDSPETWVAGPLKFKNPWEWSVSALRAIGQDQIEPQMAAGLMKELGQPVWQPKSPAGWDDIAASWAGPDALMRRVEAAQRFANRAGNGLDARSLADKLLPGGVSEATRTAVARAESPAQGLALLLVSPELLRR